MQQPPTMISYSNYCHSLLITALVFWFHRASTVIPLDLISFDLQTFQWFPSDSKWRLKSLQWTTRHYPDLISHSSSFQSLCFRHTHLFASLQICQSHSCLKTFILVIHSAWSVLPLITVLLGFCRLFLTYYYLLSVTFPEHSIYKSTPSLLPNFLLYFFLLCTNQCYYIVYHLHSHIECNQCIFACFVYCFILGSTIVCDTSKADAQ